MPKSSALGALFKAVEVEAKVEDNSHKQPLDDSTVLPLWKDFLEENKDKLQNAFMSVAMRQVPVLQGDTIRFIETNNISLELLQLHKADIVSFYLRKTTAPAVYLGFELQKKQEVEVKVSKSEKERLKDMVDQNPAILKLIQKLDLNLD